MGQLLTEIIPLGVGAMISPLLLVIQVLTLTGKSKPVARAAAITLGAALALAVITVVLLTIARGIDIGAKHGSNPTSAIVKGICAAALLGLGIRNLAHRRDTTSHRLDRLATAKTHAFFIAGLLGMLSNVTSLVLYIPAMHIIYNSQVADSGKGIAILIMYVLTMLPLLAPLTIALAMGQRSTTVLAAMNRFVTKHSSAINAGLCFVFAAYLGYGAIVAA